MAINSLSAASYGISGLASGINSQEMVEKLLSNTQGKIEKTNQQKTVLTYKQTMYRNVAAQLRSLQSSFLSFTSQTNLLSSTFYNTMISTVVPPSGSTAAFSVTASTSAKAGSVSVDRIEQLATAATYKSSKQSNGNISVGFNQSVAKNLMKTYVKDPAESVTLNIQVGSDTLSIADAPTTFASMSATEAASYINTKLADAGINAKAEYLNGKLSITAADPSQYIRVTGSGSADLAMSMLGSKGVVEGVGSVSTTIDPQKYNPSLTVDLDGRSATIYVNLNLLEEYANATPGSQASTDAQQAIMDDLSAKLKKSFGSGVQVLADGSGGFTIQPGSPSQRVTVTGKAAVLDVFGIKNGASNKINMNSSLRDLNFSSPLLGNLQKFSIEGVDFAFSADTSLSTIISSINSSAAGVNISYNEAEDRFVIERTVTGYDTEGFQLENLEGNFLTALFGVEGTGAATSTPLNKVLQGAALSAQEVADLEASIARGGQFTIKLNGVERTYTLSSKAADDNTSYTLEDFTKGINKWLAGAAGTDSAGEQNVSLEFDGSTFSVVSHSKNYTVEAVAVGSNNKDLGFTAGDSTRVKDGSVELGQTGIVFGTGASVTIGGATYMVDGSGTPAYNWNAGTTVDQIAADLQDMLVAQGSAGARVEFDSYSSSFKISGVVGEVALTIDGGTGAENVSSLLGASSLQFNQQGSIDPTGFTEGQNARLVVNGTTIERSSNTFTLDGLTFTLNATTQTGVDNNGDPVYEKPTQVTTSRDTEKIFEAVKEFVKAYNELVDMINGYYKADATYKEYPPLTDDQKAAMSDREIEKWEEKSMEGLLRGDQTLGKILQQLRGVMYAKPDSSSIAIYDLGITTSYFNGDGHLSIGSEEDLKAMIEKDPEAIKTLFSGTDGIMRSLSSTIDLATKVSYGSPGTLVQIAGSESGVYNSRISKQMKELDKQLTTLENRYWKEYNMYWSQFNAMEQLIQQMNTQSSWLSQQLSTM